MAVARWTGLVAVGVRVVGAGVIALAVGVVLLTHGPHDPEARARAAASASDVPAAADPALALGYASGCAHPQPDTPPRRGTLRSARCADPAWIAPSAPSGGALAVRFYVFRDQGVVRGAGSPAQGGYPWAVDIPDSMPRLAAMAQRTGGRVV